MDHDPRLAESEDRFRLLVERNPDTIFRYEFEPEPRLSYVSPSVEALTGHPPADFYAKLRLPLELTHPADRPALARLLSGEADPTGATRLRWIRTDGSVVWTEQRISRVERDGRLVALEGTARDITEQVRTTEALTRSEYQYRLLTEAATDGIVIVDLDGTIRYTNPTARAMVGDDPTATTLPRLSDFIAPADLALIQQCLAARLAGNREISRHALEIVARDGRHIPVEVVSVGIEEDGHLTGMLLNIRDVTEQRRTTAERDRLVSVVEQAAESVVMTDLAGSITYVNPAFERTSGYSRAELIGQNPRILRSGVQSATFYDAMWAALTNGLPWTADFVNRRKDGSLYAEQSVMWPIRDGAGAVSGYAAIKRDVTRERELESQAEKSARERAVIAATIAGLRPADAVETTARSICRQVLNLRGAASASLFIFELDGRATALGFVVAGQPDPPFRPLPAQRSRHFRERAAEGPWVEPWVNRPWHPYNRLLTGLGVLAHAYAPIRHDGTLIGLLIVAGEPSATVALMTEALPALVEFADLAGVVIGAQVAERTEVRRAHERIAAIVERSAFAPAFQPIVDLEADVVVGYEALTRFGDGVAPDVRFAEAEAVGLGLALEAATLRAALAAAESLPAGAWLNLNVSPGLILAGEPLREILRCTRRRLVLEVTEHTAIADYPAFRAALAALGPRIELAIDDAGSGFASLRHVVELRPAFVKLDRSLVADLETDTARQAMIVGLRHFERTTGCRLLAEGIETAGELSTLRSLDIGLGQGYLPGRPMPARAFVDGAIEIVA
ncbi:MAG: PAS domain S-box protein [Candidatus Limnocylindrales bacterium]